jgi:ankyrin repeat protein
MAATMFSQSREGSIPLPIRERFTSRILREIDHAKNIIMTDKIRDDVFQIKELLLRYMVIQFWKRNMAGENALMYLTRCVSKEYEPQFIVLIDFLEKESPELLRFLLNEQNVSHGYTPLFYSIYEKKSNIFYRFINTHMVKLNILNHKGQTPIFLCAALEMKEYVDYLLNPPFIHQAKLGHVTPDGDTLLIRCCFHAWEDTSMKIIESGKGYPQQVCDKGSNALLHAIVKKMPNVAIRLLETGIPQSNLIYQEDQLTPFMYACTHGFEEVALKILDFGNCCIDYITQSGETAFMLACFRKMKYVCHRMLDMDCTNLSQISVNGITAFMVCCNSTDMEEIAIRIARQTKNFHPEIPNHLGQTPLMWCIFHRNPTVAHLLLDEVEDCGIEQIDKDGDSALILAIGIGSAEIVAKILPRVSKEHIIHKNLADLSAIDFARDLELPEIYSLLSRKLEE